MLVSVIIPLYNKEQCIFDTIQSVLNQTYKNIEIVVIDDGSTDKSASVVSKIKDDRIRFIRQKNHGVAFTRNRGVDEAKGDYLLFLDADDYLYPNALETMKDGFSQYPTCDVMTGNFVVQKKNLTTIVCSYNQEGIIDNVFKLLWLHKWDIRLGSFLIKKGSINKINAFRSDIVIGEDVIYTDEIISTCQLAYTSSIVLGYNREFSLLSNKKVAPEKVYEWVMPLGNSQTHPYLRRIYLDKLFRKLVNSLIRVDFNVGISLSKKYYRFVIPSIICFSQGIISRFIQSISEK